jgi:hypothetical protein
MCHTRRIEPLFEGSPASAAVETRNVAYSFNRFVNSVHYEPGDSIGKDLRH